MLTTEMYDRTPDTDRRLQKHGESSQQYSVAIHTRTIPPNRLGSNAKGIREGSMGRMAPRRTPNLIQHDAAVGVAAIRGGTDARSRMCWDSVCAIHGRHGGSGQQFGPTGADIGIGEGNALRDAIVRGAHAAPPVSPETRHHRHDAAEDIL